MGKAYLNREEYDHAISELGLAAKGDLLFHLFISISGWLI